MKTLLLAVILFSTAAVADEAEDFAACLIGYSILAIDAGEKDPLAAQVAASDHCPLPESDEIDVDAIGAHVNEIVSALQLK
jgi:hypothetical protein